MLNASIPTKMPVIWGTSAPGADIRVVPIPSQIGIQAGAASFTDGFPPVNFVPVSGGGTPPFGQDFNGIFNVVTAWLRWVQAGGQVTYDSAFSSGGGTNIGGYPAGAVVASATYPWGRYWQATADNLTTNPDSVASSWGGWQTFPLPGSIHTGMLSPAAVPRPIVFPQTADNLILSNDTAAFTASITTNTTLNVSAVSSGFLSVGSIIAGAGVTAGTTITAFGSGVGNTGTYTITSSTNVGSESMTATTNQVNAISGRVPDASDTTWLHLAGTMSKRLDAAWVAGGSVGIPQGGLDTGSALAANSTYHVYLIARQGTAVTARARASNVATINCSNTGGPSVGSTIRVVGVGWGYDGVFLVTGASASQIQYNNVGPNESTQTVALAFVDGFDVVLSQQSVNAYPSPALPSGWTLSQCLGSIVTDANKAMRPFVQIGDEFLLGTSVALTLSGSTSASLVSLPTPIGVKTLAKLRVEAGTGSAGNYLLTSPDETDQTPTNSVSTLVPSSASASASCGCETTTRTNTSSQIRQRAAGSITPNGSCYGWRDPRRRSF